METVTYQGPSGYFVARDGDEKVTLKAGRPTEVSDEIADSLVDVEGHEFAFDGTVSDADPLDETTVDYDGDPDETDPDGSTN